MKQNSGFTHPVFLSIEFASIIVHLKILTLIVAYGCHKEGVNQASLLEGLRRDGILGLYSSRSWFPGSTAELDHTLKAQRAHDSIKQPVIPTGQEEQPQPLENPESKATAQPQAVDARFGVLGPPTEPTLKILEGYEIMETTTRTL